MTKKTPGVNTFHVSLGPERDYRVRTLSVTQRRRVHVESAMQCSTRGEYRLLKQAHVDYHFEKFLDPAAVRLHWTEHRDSAGRWTAGALEVDAGDGFDELKLGLELLETIGRVVERKRGKRIPTDCTFADPAVVIAALRNSTFVEVERFSVDRHAYWIQAVPMLAEGRAA